jgi:4-amino-4-deoxy-L-arabinose transferase-like glycosyltransferase
LAFLVKGPVGVALPLLIILAGRTASGREVLPALSALLQGAAAWCLVVLPWGLAFLRRVGAGTSMTTLRTEALERFFAGTSHVEPPWFYAKIVAVAFLPWLAPLILALGRTWRMRRDPAARTAVYAAAGLAAGLLFFSLSKGKVPTYILPLAPLIAILVIWELGREIEAPHERSCGPTLLAATLAATSACLGLAGAFRLEAPWRSVALSGAAVYGAGAIPAFYGAVARRPRWVYATAAAAAGAFLLVVAVVGFPSIGRTKSAAALVEGVPELTSGRPVVTVEMKVPSLVFYLDRPVEVVPLSEFEARLGREDRAIFVLAEVDLPQVPASVREGLHELGRQGKFRVFEARPTWLDEPPAQK